MDLKLWTDNIKKLTPKRKKAIKEYTTIQEAFKELAIAGVVRHFIIRYVQNELDIDNLTDEQNKRLDNCKDDETREHLSKELPKTDVEYNLFYITPYWIGDEVNKRDVTIEELDTDIIEAINERIKTRIDLYKDLIK